MHSPTPISPGQVVARWLRRRIGHGKLIYATGAADSSKKYLAKPKGYEPDMKAYLTGNKDHIYGSYLLREDGTTSVLAFDFDQREEELHQGHECLLRQLALAGAAPVYWLRQNNRGHLELYFDRPVDPATAYAWCISVCPDVVTVEEVYPVNEKRNNPLSWPMYQRKGTTVFPCQAKAILATNPDAICIPDPSFRSLALLISQAVTPSALFASMTPSIPQQEEQPTARAAAPVTLPIIPTPLSDADIARIVIADFNHVTTWDEITTLCGGCNRNGKFAAVWRGEITPSVKVDRDEAYACDYGRTAGWPKKLDKYEIWCLVKGGRDFKKTDLAERCAAYRKVNGQNPPGRKQA